MIGMGGARAGMGMGMGVDEPGANLQLSNMRLGGDDQYWSPNDVRPPSPSAMVNRADTPTAGNVPREPSVNDSIRTCATPYASTCSARSAARLRQIARNVLTHNKYMRSRIIDLLLFAKTNKPLIVLIMLLL